MVVTQLPRPSKIHTVPPFPVPAVAFRYLFAVDGWRRHTTTIDLCQAAEGALSVQGWWGICRIAEKFKELHPMLGNPSPQVH